jgi:import inner membrane translocase subunit TIM16
METMTKVCHFQKIISPTPICHINLSLQNYEHLFKVNSLPPKVEQPPAGKQTQIYHSHYLQSKIFRALERLEAESKLASQETVQNSGEATPPKPPPPPESPNQGSGSQ